MSDKDTAVGLALGTTSRVPSRGSGKQYQGLPISPNHMATAGAGQAPQDGGGESLRGGLGQGPRQGRFWKTEGVLGTQVNALPELHDAVMRALDFLL